jgi:hypothetical protein
MCQLVSCTFEQALHVDLKRIYTHCHIHCCLLLHLHLAPPVGLGQSQLNLSEWVGAGEQESGMHDTHSPSATG